MDPLRLALTPRMSVPRRVKTPEISDAQRKELEKLDKTCRDFESLFVYQMLKTMRKTVHKTNLVGGGQAEEIFADMLDQERSKEVSQKKGMGMAELLFSQLSRAVVPGASRR